MKKLIFLTPIIIFYNCKEKPPTIEVSPSNPHESKAIKLESPLNDLVYTSNKDLYCNMDIIKYGVSDTLTYKGKLYGFCATMCKEQFEKDPEHFLSKIGHTIKN